MTTPHGYSAYVERTSLAWRRTGLALFALAVGAARIADVTDLLLAVGLAVVVGAAALALVFAAERRVGDPRAASPWWFLVVSAGLACGVALVGVLLAVSSGASS